MTCDFWPWGGNGTQHIMKNMSREISTRGYRKEVEDHDDV